MPAGSDPAAPRSSTPAVGAAGRSGDRSWNALLTAFGLAVLAVAGLIVLSLVEVALPSWREVSFLTFLRGTDWDPVRDSFGALPFVYGTLVTSAVALLLAGPVSVAVALFLTEMAPPRLRPFVTVPLELLAGIPSVVYGLWGLAVLLPLIRPVQAFLDATVDFVPLFRLEGPNTGFGYLSAGVLLAVMVLPTITSISIEVLKTVPAGLREAALALGATRWEAIRMAVLPYARAGILGACMLGLGRALGETMAVTMLVGNKAAIHASLFAPGYSLPSVIANEFAEASSDLHTGALASLGLILFGVTLALSAGARALVGLVARGPARGPA